MLVGLSDALILRFNPGAYTDLIQSDPIRVIEAIIAGISFLGAGTIFKHPKKVKASRQPRRCCFPAQSVFAWRFGSSCWRSRSPCYLS